MESPHDLNHINHRALEDEKEVIQIDDYSTFEGGIITIECLIEISLDGWPKKSTYYYNSIRALVKIQFWIDTVPPTHFILF